MNSDPDADSDWEYEYDDTEREDIYFTLDLTTHVPNAIQEKHYAKNGKLIAPVASETTGALTAAHGQGDLDDELDHPDANATPTAEAGQLQILDLHSEKPYVKFNNSFYSCYWFTDLGTQFWVTNPGVVAEPKYSGHVLDVVASSQTRLVAMPANLKRKRGTIDFEPTTSQVATQQMDIDDDGASDVSDTDSRYQSVEYFQQDPKEPMVIPRNKIKDPHLEAQANFMERLSALKLKKGEADAHKIPMRVPVYYKGAPNADALRASHGVSLDDTTPRRMPRVPPRSASRVSPTKDNETGEGAHATDEGSPAVPTPLPKSLPRGGARGGPRGGYRKGGAPSHAERRSNLGLELMGDQPATVPKKRGRKSNAERARLAAEAAEAAGEAEVEVEVEAGAEAEGAGAEVADNAADAKPFALDPLLVGGEKSQTTTPGEAPDEELSLIKEGGHPPRKRRRNAAQMAEARRLDAERKAEKAAARKQRHQI
jgi:hypothetical protein